jgi:hypothetical protein
MKLSVNGGNEREVNTVNLTIHSVVQHSIEFENTTLEDALDRVETSFYTLEDENENALAWSDMTEMVQIHRSAEIVQQRDGEAVGESTRVFGKRFDFQMIVRVLLWSAGFLTWWFIDEVPNVFAFLALALGLAILALRKFLRIKYLYVPSKSDLTRIGNWSFIVVGNANIEMFYETKYLNKESQVQEAKSLIGLSDPIDDDVIELESYCIVTSPLTIELEVGDAFRVVKVSEDLPKEVSLNNLNKFSKALGFSTYAVDLATASIGISVALFLLNL